MNRKWLLLTLVAAAPVAAFTRAAGQPGAKGGAQPATVDVRLPANAKLFVENAECPLKSDTRKFKTEPLEPGKEYEYTLRAEIEQNKRTVGVTLTAVVTAGKTTEVRFGDEKAFLVAGGLASPPPPPPAPLPPPPVVVAPVRFPAGPPPWLALAMVDSDGDLAWKWPTDAGEVRSRYLLAGAFSARLVSGTELWNAEMRKRLRQRTAVLVASDGKPIDPFYLALFSPETVVVVPKNSFPPTVPPVPPVTFGIVGPGEWKTRVRWTRGATATVADEKSATDPESRVRITRFTIAEQVVELSHTDLVAYDVDGNPLRPAQLATLVERDVPVILLDAGRKPDPLLLKAMKKDSRLLVLPVGFRAP